MQNILSVIGTRPQLIKLSAIVKAFDKFGLRHEYIDTGQHYDYSLTEAISQDLNLNPPLFNLKIGSETHAKQTANIMVKLEEKLLNIRPNYLLVYGDTNSTLAATLVATKLRIPVAHIESGLRSFNRSMPEELNRIATDHLANVLFAPTLKAQKQLENEGLGDRTIFSGDVICDVLRENEDKYRNWKLPSSIKKNDYFVCTIHRAENTDEQDQLIKLLWGLENTRKKIFLFAHPRLMSRVKSFKLSFPTNVIVKEPVSQTEMISWMINSKGIITDSGGLQKEAFILKIPCTTLRSETEWLETLENGWNVLVSDPKFLPYYLNTNRNRPQSQPFGNGRASEIIVDHLLKLQR